MKRVSQAAEELSAPVPTRTSGLPPAPTRRDPPPPAAHPQMDAGLPPPKPTRRAPSPPVYHAGSVPVPSARPFMDHHLAVSEVPGLLRSGLRCYAVTYPDEAVGIWVGRWTYLLRRYTQAVQGERFQNVEAARQALLRPTEESWVPLRGAW